MATGTSPTAKLRVLIVDDFGDLADSTAIMLRLAGYSANVAYNGFDGLQQARTLSHDVLLIDTGMPAMDGFTLAERLRCERLLKHLVVVALTDGGTVEAARRCQEAGFLHHLLKPVEPALLLALLEKLASKRQPAFRIGHQVALPDYTPSSFSTGTSTATRLEPSPLQMKQGDLSLPIMPVPPHSSQNIAILTR